MGVERLTELQESVLKRICESEDYENTATLAQGLGKDTTTIWRSSKSLIKNKFLASERHPEKIKNVHVLKPTDKGILFAIGYLDCKLSNRYVQYLYGIMHEKICQIRVTENRKYTDEELFEVLTKAGEFKTPTDTRLMLYKLMSEAQVNSSDKKQIDFSQFRVAFGHFARFYIEYDFFDDKGDFVPYMKVIRTDGEFKKEEQQIFLRALTDPRLDAEIFRRIMRSIRNKRVYTIVEQQLRTEKDNVERKLEIFEKDKKWV